MINEGPDCRNRKDLPGQPVHSPAWLRTAPQHITISQAWALRGIPQVRGAAQSSQSPCILSRLSFDRHASIIDKDLK